MKIKIILFLLLITSTTIIGQTEKGKFYLGVNSNLNFTNTSTKIERNGATSEGQTKNQFVVSPEVGYFLVDNLVAGLNVFFSFSDNENSLSTSQSNNYYIISPFVKYYFLENNFKPFLNAKYGFGSISGEGSYTIDFGNGLQNFNLNDTAIRNLELGGGLAYFVNNYVSIELNLNYINQESTTEGSFLDSSEVVSTKSGFQTLVGFSVLF